MTSALLVVDTLDDRREVWTLLHKLPPGDRVRFLRACCERVKRPDGTGPVPLHKRGDVEQAYRCGRADLRLTNAVYFEWLVLGGQWGLDLAASAAELERMVRRGVPPSCAAPPRPSGSARTACTGG